MEHNNVINTIKQIYYKINISAKTYSQKVLTHNITLIYRHQNIIVNSSTLVYHNNKKVLIYIIRI